MQRLKIETYGLGACYVNKVYLYSLLLGILFISGCESSIVRNGTDTHHSHSNVQFSNTPANVVHSSTGGQGSQSTIPASMSAEEIGKYDEMTGGAPSFGGHGVIRLNTSLAPSALPDGFKVQNSDEKFMEKHFEIIDSWKGELRNGSFLLDIYSEKRSDDIMVAAKYDHHPILAFSLESSKYVLRGFTGGYVIFGVPSLNGKYYAFNLVTGQVVYPSKLTMQMAGCYPCTGAAGPNWITGLQQKYPFRQ